MGVKWLYRIFNWDFARNGFWRVFSFALLLSAVCGGLLSPPRLEAARVNDPELEYRSYWDQGEYQQALDVIQKQMEARPEFAESRVYRSFVWRSHRAALNFAMGRVDEAIADMEWIVETNVEPVFLLRLTEYYKYRGRLEDFENTLLRASSRSSWVFHTQEENVLALARIVELQGDDPKRILTTFYTTLMENRPEFAPGFVGAGDLTLSKGAYDLAEDYYRKALAVDEKNQDALAGLAECYWKASDSRAVEIIEQLLTINPRHCRAKALEAELLLDSGEAEPALEKIEEALKVNPNHIRLRSLKAGALFLQDELDAMRKVQEETLQFNPHCSAVYRVPGRIASRRYRFEEGASFQEKALQIDSKDKEARALYALDLLRLGRDEEGKRELEQAFKDDPFNTHLFNSLNLMDSLESFDTVRRGAFMLRLPKEETAFLAEDALALLSEACAIYEKKYKIELEKPVSVQIFDSHDDFMVRSVGLPGNVGFMGICFGKLITMDSPSARTKRTMNWRQVLWHEFVHVVTLQKTKNRLTRWLSEGISVYEETQRNPGWGQKMEIHYKALIGENDLPGIADLELYFTQPKSISHVILGYFLASEFAHYYIDEYGIDSLVDALTRIGEGEHTDRALAVAANRSVRSIDRGFQRFLTERLSPFNNLPAIKAPQNEFQKMMDLRDAPPQEEDWTQQSSPFTDAMRKGSDALKLEQWEEAESEFKKAFELFPDYTGTWAPLRQLIRLYELWEQPEKLKETLWRVMEWDPTDYASAQKLIGLLREKNDWEGVEKAARWAMGIDPFDGGMRKTLLEAMLQTGKEKDALSLTHSLAALEPARRTDYHFQRIEILMKLEEWENAKKETIQLLEEFPHFWEAQRLLLAIVEREDGGDEK